MLKEQHQVSIVVVGIRQANSICEPTTLFVTAIWEVCREPDARRDGQVGR